MNSVSAQTSPFSSAAVSRQTTPAPPTPQSRLPPTLSGEQRYPCNGLGIKGIGLGAIGLGAGVAAHQILKKRFNGKPTGPKKIVNATNFYRM